MKELPLEGKQVKKKYSHKRLTVMNNLTALQHRQSQTFRYRGKIKNPLILGKSLFQDRPPGMIDSLLLLVGILIV